MQVSRRRASRRAVPVPLRLATMARRFASTASLDTTLYRQLLRLGRALDRNAVARAMTYYHRPGNWKEHPNFFNPFWRAKLAPVMVGLGNTPLGGLFGGTLGTLLGENLLTH